MTILSDKILLQVNMCPKQYIPKEYDLKFDFPTKYKPQKPKKFIKSNKKYKSLRQISKYSIISKLSIVN